MGTTLTLATGRVLDVTGTYEDVTAQLAPRTLSEDDGMRELRTADGGRVTVSRGAIIAIEQAGATRQVGFA